MSADTSGGLHGHTIEQADLIKHRESNARLSIYKLPPEVLLLIFKSFAVIEWQGGDVPWIKITHIFHAWREIALSSPTLWSRIRITPSTSVERVVEWLQRSQHAPLTVTALPILQIHEGPVRLDVYRVIFQELYRIRELEVALPGDLVHLLDWPNTPHDHLAHLAIKDSLAIGGPSIRSWTLPSRAAELFPSLVSLTAFRIPLHSWKLPCTLTTLKIWDATSVQPSTVEQILFILQSLPLLQKIDLARGLLGKSLSAPTLSTTRTVALLHLHSLSLTEHPLAMAELLRHLVVPEDVRLQLTFLLNTDSFPHLSDVARFVASWIGRTNRPWRTASLTFPTYTADDVDGGQLIFAVRKDASTRRMSMDWTLSASLLIRLEDDNEAPVDDFWELQRLDSFLSGFHLSDITHLYLQVKDDILHPHLPAVWNSMTNVQAIYVHGPEFNVSATGLCVLDPVHAGALLFPSLRVLYMEGFLCHTGMEDLDSHFDGLLNFRQVLIARRERGAQLERLIVRESEIHKPEEVELLQDTVAMEWVSEQDFGRERTEPSVDQQAVMIGIAQLIAGLEPDTEFVSDMEDGED